MAEILIGSIKKGEAEGVAELDASGCVPVSQLPSYVNDVLEFANLAAFPAPGETGKIYIATDTNKMYRWSGAGYAEISALSKRRADTLYANALIGNASGDIVQVEDAWEADAIGLMIPGKSVQDGTPTPDAPVEVDVVDGPVTVQMTGANLLDTSSYIGTSNISNVVWDENTGYLKFDYNGNYAAVSFYMPVVAGSFKFEIKNQSNTSSAKTVVTCEVVNVDNKTRYSNANDITIYATDKRVLVRVFGNNSPKYLSGTATCTLENLVQSSSNYGAYEPYTSTQQTITLPPDHSYLASLPDGTHDELVLRSDGVAVMAVRTANITSYAGESVTTSYRSTTGALTTGATVIYGVPLTTKYSADNGTTWSTTDPAAGTSAIPLQKGTNNVWCTDRLSPEVALDYVQDTNKVINELRAAIVASGATS